MSESYVDHDGNGTRFTVPVTPETPLPVTVAGLDASSGIATEDTQQDVLAQLVAQLVVLNSILTELQSSPTYLPAVPPMAPGDFTTPFLLDSVSTSDITIAAAAGANIKTRLYTGQLTVTGGLATTLKIYDDASATGAVVWRRDVPAGGGIIDFEWTGRAWCKSAANKPLVLKQTAAAQLSGTLYCIQSTTA